MFWSSWWSSSCCSAQAPPDVARGVGRPCASSRPRPRACAAVAPPGAGPGRPCGAAGRHRAPGCVRAPRPPRLARPRCRPPTAPLPGRPGHGEQIAQPVPPPTAPRARRSQDVRPVVAGEVSPGAPVAQARMPRNPDGSMTLFEHPRVPGPAVPVGARSARGCGSPTSTTTRIFDLVRRPSTRGRGGQGAGPDDHACISGVTDAFTLQLQIVSDRRPRRVAADLALPAVAVPHAPRA